MATKIQSVEPNITDLANGELLISAIQKLTIKDVVRYAERTMAAMEEVI